MRIKNRLKEVLEEKHMTQRELSLRTGISESTISRYITESRKINVLNLLVIAYCVGVDAREILVIEEEVEANIYNNFDITFCSKVNCNDKQCRRNRNNYDFSNLKNRPISTANFEECEHWKE